MERRAPPNSAREERSGWLRGSMGTTSMTPRVSREGFVGNQKDGSSPGPGAYEHGSDFHAKKGPGFNSRAKRFHDPQPVGMTPYSGPNEWKAHGAKDNAAFGTSISPIRAEWLHNEVGGHGAVSGSSSHHVAAQRPQAWDSPGPGAYESRSPTAPLPKMGRDARFHAAYGNPNVGPGSYHSYRPASARAAPTETQVMRDSWLKGSAGGHQVITGSAAQHVDRQHYLVSPGPGAYEARTDFARAMAPNLHQVPLSQRY